MSQRFDLREVAQSPKSTLVGLCVLALAAERGVHFDAAGHLAMSARDWFDVGCGTLTAVVSALTKDAARVNTPQTVDTADPTQTS
jgi:hypothetical protein